MLHALGGPAAFVVALTVCAASQAARAETREFCDSVKLTASDGATDDAFGARVALDGDTLIVGAVFDDGAAGSDQGAAYIFTRSGSTWTQQAKLTAADAAAGDQFGFSVALDGDTALVGANGDDGAAGVNQGSAYVFTRSGSTWTQQAKLTASDAGFSDSFGVSVSLDGDAALVGAWLDDNQGSAYVFARSGSTWTQQAKLTAFDGELNDGFGSSVALDGGTALVAAVLDSGATGTNEGSAYVFVDAGSSWALQAKIIALDAAPSDFFGSGVALDADTALIGARLDDGAAGSNQGSAYVFTRSGSSWTQQAKLTAADAAAFDGFGVSVALDGDTALVGASEDDGAAGVDEGSAYAFTRSGSVWTEQEKLTAPDAAPLDRFGFSVALDGDTALVGADFADGAGGIDQGAAYALRCNAADLNGDGVIDGADLGLLLGAWGACAGCAADLNGDGVVDGADLGLLLGAWGA